MAEGMKRRDFLKVLGVTGAGATVAGCSTGEVERLIPYVIPPEDIVPGVPTWYTSTCRECPAGCGIHVETHEGRATKVEGNPDHPVSRGNLCARGQASVQGLYHPDRYKGPLRSEAGLGSTNISWTAVEREMADRIRALQQAGRANRIVYLTGNYTGTMQRLTDDWVAAIGARRVVYAPFADQPRDLEFADADLLISFGADFLETWGSPVDYAWQFAQMRDYRIGQRGKFVWVGPHRPLTGLNADQWIAPRPGSEAFLALALTGDVDLATAERATGVAGAVLEQLVREFRGAGNAVVLGPGPVLGGPNLGALRQAVARLNGQGLAPAAPDVDSMAEVLALTEQMRRGEVDLILIDGQNPAYGLPGGVRFAEALARVPTRFSFATFPEETSLLCDFVLPNHHFLEAWDDYVPTPGVYELVQPAMRPVFNTRHTGDVLLNVARLLGIESVSAGIVADDFYEYLRANWAPLVDGEQGWTLAVQRGGVFPDPEALLVSAGPGLEGAPVAAAAPVAEFAPVPETRFGPVEFPEGDEATFHLVVYPSYRFFDGRTANRPWLLELPDPVTKVSWGSWVEIHPRAARALGIEQGDVLEVASPHGAVRAPAYVWPGVRPDSVAIQMGLGHEAFGRFTEHRGVNPNVLLGPTADPLTGEIVAAGQSVRVRRTGEDKPVWQGLFEGGVRVQHDRELAQAVSLATLARMDTPPLIPGEAEVVESLKGNGGFAPTETETDPSEYPPPGTHYGQYVEYAPRWAMTIDLSRCIGCSACVTACYAENNIPVVGPEQVAKGREMTWIRIERYFGVGREEEEAYRDDATDDVRFLPMLCQHCGNAPCEPVCPVYAAYHTPDGLNGQVYNRCVGTRYCANNCPYKVRYFNWFTYDFVEPLNWQLNPDVTVREKGVMEKCTFCVQRIRQADRLAARENRPVRDGEVVPACVQTCPTEVFVFGNIQDPNSQVARAARSNRGYRALETGPGINVQPAIVYLKKVTLQEPAIGGHHAEPAGAATHGVE